MSIKLKWVETQSEFQDCLNLRQVVFTDEQGFDAAIDRDEIDDTAEHLMALDKDKLIGTARTFPMDDYYKIGRFCILKEYRGQNIGKKMIEEILQILKEKNVSTVKLSSQYRARKFYASCGFSEQGEIYMEDGLEHILMICKL